MYHSVWLVRRNLGDFPRVSSSVSESEEGVARKANAVGSGTVGEVGEENWKGNGAPEAGIPGWKRSPAPGTLSLSQQTVASRSDLRS